MSETEVGDILEFLSGGAGKKVNTKSTDTRPASLRWSEKKARPFDKEGKFMFVSSAPSKKTRKVRKAVTSRTLASLIKKWSKPIPEETDVLVFLHPEARIMGTLADITVALSTSTAFRNRVGDPALLRLQYKDFIGTATNASKLAEAVAIADLENSKLSSTKQTVSDRDYRSIMQLAVAYMNGSTFWTKRKSSTVTKIKSSAWRLFKKQAGYAAPKLVEYDAAAQKFKISSNKVTLPLTVQHVAVGNLIFTDSNVWEFYKRSIESERVEAGGTLEEVQAVLTAAIVDAAPARAFV